MAPFPEPSFQDISVLHRTAAGECVENRQQNDGSYGRDYNTADDAGKRDAKDMGQEATDDRAKQARDQIADEAAATAHNHMR